MYIKPSSVLRWGTWALLAAISVWLSFRFLLPCLAPFIAAFILARILEPAVKLLCRRGWKREFASGFCSLILLGLMLIGLWALLSRGLKELAALSQALPEMLSVAGELIGSLQRRAGAWRSFAPPELTAMLDSALRAVMASFASIPAEISQRLISLLSAAAAQMPGILLFTATTGIGVYFISAAYPGIQAWLDIHLTDIWRRRRLLLGAGVRFTVGRYIRAQGILMLISFLQLLLGFMLLNIEGALVISAAVAFLDALPVLGAGIVLLPWAAINLLTGSTAQALGLIILWGVLTLMRNCIQAKLLGSQLGLHPLITLMSIYAGWCLAGVWGMVLFPMLALMAKQLNIASLFRRAAHGG